MTSCPCCGERLEAIALQSPRGPYYIWRICDVQRRGWALSDSRIAQADAERRQELAEQQLGDPGLARIAHLTLEAFDPDRLLVRLGDENPFDLLCHWLARIHEIGAEGDYHRGPPVALHLYNPKKGTGKTHLGAGAALRARGWGRLAVFLEHESYLKRCWSVPFKDLERMAALPGELAWLSVLDDLGLYAPSNNNPQSEQKIWGDLINRRWLARRWLIITSNKTIAELELQGTLTEAAAARLRQMTRDQVVLVNAEDQRRPQ